MRDLAGAAGGDAAHAVLRGEDGRVARFGPGDPPLGADQMARMRYLRSYSPDDFPAASPFRALRARADAGGEVWVIVSRQNGDLPASVSILLGDLAPHLALAAAQYWQAQRSAAHSAAMAYMAERLGYGWAAVAPQGVVIAAHNAPAALVQGDRLRLPAAAQKAVQDAVDKGAILAIPLPSAQILLVPAPLGGILYFATPQDRQVWPAEPLAQLFGLTRTEARFAARLAAGDTIALAGERLNFTPQTARYYSKQIYAKMGVAGLPQAISRIENSVYRLL